MPVTRRTPTRVDSTGERMTERLVVTGPDPLPLPEFLNALTDALGDTPWREVEIHNGLVSWQRPATTEEKQEHDTYQRRHAERVEKWERETYERLKAKYEVAK